jgi:(2R)-sulfolactate sulfo-lyase subunit alpha
MSYGFLIHGDDDHVGVAVRDLKQGESVTGVSQRGHREVTVTLQHDVPLGHKVALERRQIGEPVVKYNEIIGLASAPIAVGDHVHVHNIRSVRWG